MDTKKLAYFLRLHENGNITHTAKEVFLTQSALTKMIQGWEEEFHCKLLTRSRKGVRFTREGDLFVTLCQQILALEKHSEKMYHQRPMNSPDPSPLGSP